MTIPRLKVYRKSVMARTRGYEVCSCGSDGCNYERFKNQDNQHYMNLLIERGRVNKELARKQTVDRKAKENPLTKVRTIREEEALVSKRDGGWRCTIKLSREKRREIRQHNAKVEEARGPKRHIVFRFEHKSQIVEGKFGYDTPEGCRGAAESMRKNPMFTKVEIV